MPQKEEKNRTRLAVGDILDYPHKMHVAQQQTLQYESCCSTPKQLLTSVAWGGLVDDAWVYIEIHKGVYGLKPAFVLSNKLLVKRLDTQGYYPCQCTPGLWRHK